jgi:Ca2+-binding RTX toxin-like protein
VVVDQNSDARMAQTFAPSLSGRVTRAEMDVADVSGQSEDYVVQLLAADGSGAPTGTVLAQTTAPDVPDGQATLHATFPIQPTILAGQTYALALSRPGGYLGWDMRSDSPECPGGFFFQEGGGSWFGTVPGFGAADALFRLFATPGRTFTASGSSAVGCRGRPATITGTEGNDTLMGTAGSDVIVGLGGRDDISGLAGNDLICGGSGRDTLRGGKGNDRLYGEAGKDILRGGAGRDKQVQ